MPALSAGDQTIWRTAPYSIRTDVFVHAPATVFAALVNQAVFTFPLSALTFDTVTTGAYTDIKEGQLLLIGTAAGKDDLGRTRVRKALDGTVATATTLNIQRSAQGARDGEINPANDMYLTVLDLRKPWSTAPYLDNDGVTYMDADKTFTNDRSYPPVANGDPDVLKVVRDGSASVDISFGNVAGFVSNPEASASLTHSWAFHSTCTPATSTSATVTVTVPVNTVFYAAHTVTDDQGTASTHYALVAVVTAGHADLHPCRIVSHVARADGQQVQLEFASDLPYTTYPDGTEVLIAKTERFGAAAADLAGVTDRKQMLFAGWIYEEENEGRATERGFVSRSRVTCYDAAQWLAVLPGFPTVVAREASPTQWEHMKEATIGRYVHRILHAYSNILTRACFEWSGLTNAGLPFPTLGSDGMSLYEQADQRAQAVGGKLTCDKHGRLALKPDAQLEDTGTRTTTVIVPIEERDWRLYRYRFTRPPRVHWNWGEAIGAAAIDAADIGEVTTFFCVAPGEAPGQGLGNQTSGQQLVDSQTQLNTREGHRYATRMNNQYGYIEVTLRGGDAGIEPALMEWVQFEVTSATAGPRGRTFSTATDRFLPIELNYDYDAEGGVRVCRVTIEKEVQGTAAVTYYPPQDYYPGLPFPTNPYPDPVITFPDTTYPQDYWLRGGLNRIALICQNGLARTTNFGQGAATVWDYQAWTAFSPAAVIGAGRGAYTAVPDAFSYASGSSVKCWVLYANNNAAAVIYYLDIAARTWTLKHSFGSLSFGLVAANNNGGGIDASYGTQNFLIAQATNGTAVAYTTDGSTFTNVTVGVTYVYPDHSPCGVYASSRAAGYGVLTSRKSGSTTFAHETTDYGATWLDTSDPNMDIAAQGASSIHSPPDTAHNPGENIFFYGVNRINTTPAQAVIYRANGASRTSITPSVGGVLYRPFGPRNGLSTFAGNANRLLLAGFGNDSSNGNVNSTRRLFLTDNALAATPTWTELTSDIAVAAMSGYGACAIAGDSGSTFYLWSGLRGTEAAVALSTDSGATIRSQAGNLSSFSPGEVRMLVGW